MVGGFASHDGGLIVVSRQGDVGTQVRSKVNGLTYGLPDHRQHLTGHPLAERFCLGLVRPDNEGIEARFVDDDHVLARFQT